LLKEEAVPESLKNILLVMSSGGYLVPPQENPANEKLWNQTWLRLERFLPDLYSELYPEEAKARPSATPAQESSLKSSA
jgi:brefeldin A-resistance guanine nucleotide exchange factor 1